MSTLLFISPEWVPCCEAVHPVAVQQVTGETIVAECLSCDATHLLNGPQCALIWCEMRRHARAVRE